jgi:hypothetical protein
MVVGGRTDVGFNLSLLSLVPLLVNEGAFSLTIELDALMRRMYKLESKQCYS